MHWLVTGGAGFIGTNTAMSLLSLGENVTIFDNFSRPGTEENISLVRNHTRCHVIHGDVTREEQIMPAIRDAQPDILLHLAAQVAVTTSVENPRDDFTVNALGTFNVLEALHQHSPDTILLNASTNKVYGKMEDIALTERAERYAHQMSACGITESGNLDFYSPYGCSKGAAEQYVLDYCRIYGIRTVNFRQSCIYGPNQFGLEDQGWVAWFIIATVLKKPLTLYGDGKQVRDILYIDDLVCIYQKAVERIDKVAGQSLNVGGGPSNSLSLLELLDMLEELDGRHIDSSLADWRPGNQEMYISDIRKASALLLWEPAISPGLGVERLYRWVCDNSDTITRVLKPHAYLGSLMHVPTVSPGATST